MPRGQCQWGRVSLMRGARARSVEVMDLQVEREVAIYDVPNMNLINVFLVSEAVDLGLTTP